MQGERVSNETKEGAVERFMKGLTRKNKVKRYQAYGDKIPTKTETRITQFADTELLEQLFSIGRCIS